MIRYCIAFVLAAVMAVSAPAAAAVTRSAGVVDESPRSGWLEHYQESRQGPEQTERFSETYKVGPDAALDLSHIAGDVTVATGAGNLIRVDAIKRVRYRDTEEGKRLLGALRVDVNQVGNRLEVRTIYPRMGNYRSLSLSVDYTITVPPSTAVAIKTVSGDVAINGVRGEVRAETVSGDVELIATPNLALAKAVSGDVRARDIGAESTLTLSTISGTVYATGLKVRTLEAGSVSGDIDLTNLEIERLMAKTVSGNIGFDGSLARSGRYEFNAHSGNVRLILVNPSGFELDASSFSGSIRSDFPVTLRSTNGDRRGNRGGAIRGVFGDASAVVSVRSFSGTVVISKK
jgi:hypothetical protein